MKGLFGIHFKYVDFLNYEEVQEYETHEEIITTLVTKYNIDQAQAESYYEQVMALRA